MRAERRFSAADDWGYQAGGCAQNMHSGVVRRPGDRRIMSLASRTSAVTWLTWPDFSGGASGWLRLAAYSPSPAWWNAVQAYFRFWLARTAVPSASRQEHALPGADRQHCPAYQGSWAGLVLAGRTDFLCPSDPGAVP